MKIGIITMHKVVNFGSVLQAYALQKKLQLMGFDNELINYDYHPPVRKQRVVSKLMSFVIKLFFGSIMKRKLKRFEDFTRRNLSIGENLYTQDNISVDIPNYDIFMSGSDQVWNPNFIKNDTSFLLSFVPDNKPRISYASSFAINQIPEEYKEIYASELRKFHAISVRESTGKDIVKELINKNAQVVCDPTLLLDRADWDQLANQSKLHIDYPYVLVYVLTYMYNPYPEINKLIDKVQKELGNMKLIILEGSKKDLFRGNSTLIKDAGPNEFVYLFKNASFVITTSFHGTAFSVIYEKPFYAVVRSKESLDNRIPSLLNKLDCGRNLINYNDKEIASKQELLSMKCKRNNLNRFVDESETFLHKSVMI